MMRNGYENLEEFKADRTDFEAESHQEILIEEEASIAMEIKNPNLIGVKEAPHETWWRKEIINRSIQGR